MGRKSREKRERVQRSQALRPPRFMTVGLHESFRDLRCVYRFVESEAYANDLLSGNVWITTLEACRRAEGDQRRDEHDGRLIQHFNHVTSEDPRFQAAIGQSGLFKSESGGPITGSSIQGLTVISGPSDAYLLCTTEAFAPEEMEGGFGKWCVKIDRPYEFFMLVTQHLAFAKDVNECGAGPVRYTGRVLLDYETVDYPPVMLKPEDGYSHQREVRFVWRNRGTQSDYRPFMLNCPPVAEFCSLHSAPCRP